MNSPEVLHGRVLELLEDWRGRSTINEALREFDQTDVFVAGGLLRDLFSARTRAPRDFDFFLGGEDVPEFIAWLSEHGTLTQGPFGSARWWPPGEGARYADVISIADFYNGLWKCRDIVDALNQFDFTANAVALDLRSGKLFDPQNGMRDARDRVMRAVRFDYPDELISGTCPLSRLSVIWIRFVHYASHLGYSVEPVTRNWLLENARFREDAEVFRQFFFPPVIDWIAKL
jgi:hypothetical protein